MPNSRKERFLVSISNTNYTVDDLMLVVTRKNSQNCYPKAVLLPNPQQYELIKEHFFGRSFTIESEFKIHPPSLVEQKILIHNARIAILPPLESFKGYFVDQPCEINIESTETELSIKLPPSPKNTITFSLSSNKNLFTSKILRTEDLTSDDDLELIIDGIKFDLFPFNRCKQEQNGDVFVERVPTLSAKDDIKTNLDINKVRVKLDDLLIVISAITGTRTFYTEYHQNYGEIFRSFYIRNSDFKSYEQDEMLAISDTHNIPSLITECSELLEKETYSKSLIEAFLPLSHFYPENIEARFIRLFAALETLILDHKRNKNLEHAIPIDTWIEVKPKLKKIIKKANSELGISNKEADSLAQKIDELNRLPFRKGYDSFFQENKIFRGDLWPVFKNDDISFGLSDIRNKIAHGDFRGGETIPCLGHAVEHLTILLSRVTMHLLGVDVSKLRIGRLTDRNYLSYLTKSMKEDAEILKRHN